MILRIEARREETPDIMSLDLRAADPSVPLPRFTAGAHVDVEAAPGLVRQYSLLNDPAETHRYVIAVLREAPSRGGSETLHRSCRTGGTVSVGVPRNSFPLDERASRTVLVAGGIGITPLLSMAHRLHARGQDFALHYCARTASRAAFVADLAQGPLRAAVSFHFDDGPPDRRFSVDANIGPPAPGTRIYVCGPDGFMNHVLDRAARLGWPAGHISVERFRPPQTGPAGAVFTVRAARSGVEVTVGDGDTIAGALARAGVAVALSCEQGICGTCLTRVLEGVPDHRDMFQTDAEKASGWRMAICCSRAVSDRLVLDV